MTKEERLFKKFMKGTATDEECEFLASKGYIKRTDDLIKKVKSLSDDELLEELDNLNCILFELLCFEDTEKTEFERNAELSSARLQYQITQREAWLRDLLDDDDD